MSINTYTVRTGMGRIRSDDEFANVLTTEQLKELNSIGYSRKTLAGERTTREIYLNSLGIGEFDVTQRGWDSGDFAEEFTIVHVTQ